MTTDGSGRCTRRHLLGLAVAAGAGMRLPEAVALADRTSTGNDEPDAIASETARHRTLEFPRDHGAHPDFRTEWWYLTGWLDAAPSPFRSPLGLHLTFFRVRTGVAQQNPSVFAARQLVLAHVALADPVHGRLLHDQRMDRALPGIAVAKVDDTGLKLGDWSFLRDSGKDRYMAHIEAREFGLDLEAVPVGPPLLQGEGGWSQKGPDPEQASHYYSRPQLALSVDLRRDGRRETLSGSGWLDHEWSGSLLDPTAAGWDWMGMNLAYGGSLTAFQIRPKAGGDPLWAYASLVDGAGRRTDFGPDDVRFEPLDHWTSPRTGVTWPVAQRLRAGRHLFETRPLMRDQELDSRATTGAIYWEGASTLRSGGRDIGHGYLELTGYAEPLRL